MGGDRRAGGLDMHGPPSDVRRWPRDELLKLVESAWLRGHGGASFPMARASCAQFLGLMVRAGAVVDKIGVVSAYFGEGLGQVMGLFGDVSGAVVPGRDPEAVR
jgi:hypothetical protein